MHFDDDSLAAFRAAGQRREVTRGTQIFVEGDPPGDVVLIESGRIQISAESEDGFEVLLAVRGEGELLGEFSALDALPRTASATALEDCVLTAVARADFLDWLQARPNVMFALLVSLVAVVREPRATRLDQPAGEIDQRVALRLERLMLEHADALRDGELRLAPSPSIEALAEYCGTRPEVIDRTLGRLETQGVLTVGRDELIVHEPSSLSRYATS